MNETFIEWCQNPDGSQGYTWNPITGCLNGCDYCYARRLANTRLRKRYLANHNLATGSFQAPGGRPIEPYKDPFYPRFWPNRLRELQDRHTHNNRLHKSIGVFVCDMSDLFGIGIPEEWTRRVLDVISSQMIYPAQNDHFYLLTKQPQNLLKFSPFPDNCWVGVTVTNKEMFDKAVYHLSEVAAHIKYLSIEPLLGSVLYDEKPFWGGVDWIIIGAQTKPTKLPQLHELKEIVTAADTADIPVFLKNNLGLLARQADMNSPFWNNPRWKLLRQEMPK